MKESEKLNNMTPRQALDRAMIGAAFVGDLAEVRRLLDAGARVDAKSKQGKTALQLVKGGDTGIRSLLLAYGAKIDAQDDRGRTALHQDAAHRDEVGSVRCKWLLEQGANVNVTNKEGNTPIYESVGWGCHATCQVLIDGGANLEHTNKNRYTVLEQAALAENEPMCLRLIANGASTKDTQSASKATEAALTLNPLQAAARLGDACLLLKVLTCDPDPVSLPERASQALAMALDAGHEGLATLLRSWVAKYAVLDAITEINQSSQARP